MQQHLQPYSAQQRGKQETEPKKAESNQNDKRYIVIMNGAVQDMPTFDRSKPKVQVSSGTRMSISLVEQFILKGATPGSVVELIELGPVLYKWTVGIQKEDFNDEGKATGTPQAPAKEEDKGRGKKKEDK